MPDLPPNLQWNREMSSICRRTIHPPLNTIQVEFSRRIHRIMRFFFLLCTRRQAVGGTAFCLVALLVAGDGGGPETVQAQPLNKHPSNPLWRGWFWVPGCGCSKVAWPSPNIKPSASSNYCKQAHPIGRLMLSQDQSRSDIQFYSSSKNMGSLSILWLCQNWDYFNSADSCKPCPYESIRLAMVWVPTYNDSSLVPIGWTLNVVCLQGSSTIQCMTWWAKSVIGSGILEEEIFLASMNAFVVATGKAPRALGLKSVQGF
jgi:hypothetical protein